MYPIFHPLYLYIKLFIMHFLCIQAVRPCHIQKFISQHLFEISTKFFQYSRTHDLLSHHHIYQVAPKLQSRSHLVKKRPPFPKGTVLLLSKNTDTSVVIGLEVTMSVQGAHDYLKFHLRLFYNQLKTNLRPTDNMLISK